MAEVSTAQGSEGLSDTLMKYGRVGIDETRTASVVRPTKVIGSRRIWTVQQGYSKRTREMAEVSSAAAVLSAVGDEPTHIGRAVDRRRGSPDMAWLPPIRMSPCPQWSRRKN